MGKPSYLCSVLFVRAPVLGLRFFVSVTPVYPVCNEGRVLAPIAHIMGFGG